MVYEGKQISAIDGREGSIVNLSEGGPTLFIEVDICGLGGGLAVA
jgi:hypothetical protein